MTVDILKAKYVLGSIFWVVFSRMIARSPWLASFQVVNRKHNGSNRFMLGGACANNRNTQMGGRVPGGRSGQEQDLKLFWRVRMGQLCVPTAASSLTETHRWVGAGERSGPEQV